MGVFLGYDLSEGCPGQFYRAVCELLQQFLYCIGVGWDKVFYFYYYFIMLVI